MSLPITITRSTATTTLSAIILYTGYFKTWPGLLKLAELIFGAVCVGIVAYYTSRYQNAYDYTAEIFFLLMATAFLIATTCLILSCLHSQSTASIIMKTLYEVLYHSVGFILLLAASLILLIVVSNSKRCYNYKPYLAAAVIGLVNSILYLLSAILGYRYYRGI